MKVTYYWLKDFVEISISARALADKFTMAGLEVVSLEEKEGDFVFEIEVTSNRPDWLSVAGIAQEVAAMTGKKLKSPKIIHRLPSANQDKQLFLKTEDKKDCPLYIARIIKGVKVGPSPDWLKKRLELIGCRSINNIVDITNYVMFEWGQPLHAFDLDKLSGPGIIVRRAKANEKITTLDEEQHALDPEILVIADIEKPVAVAGVMGGKDTEVSAGTKNVFLEAAVFNPIIIRRAKRILGVQSESAYRFERCINLAATDKISERAASLILDIAGGQHVLKKATTSILPSKKKINLDVNRATEILGTPVKKETIEKILKNLGLGISAKTKNRLVVAIPSHRPDINAEEDLIEEIGRIFGYDNIPTTLPRVNPTAAQEPESLIYRTKQVLAGLGLHEAITYSLVGRESLRDFAAAVELIEIANPLSQDQEVLRPTIIPSLLRCVAYNLNQKQPYVNIFEVAKKFSKMEGKTKEESVLGIALCGTRSLLLEQGLVKDEAGFLHLKGIISTLLGNLGIKDYDFAITDNPGEVTVSCAGETIGIMRKPTAVVLERMEIKNKQAYVAEINLEQVFAKANLAKRLAPLPLYPAITRDISIVIRQEIKIQDILGAIKVKAQHLLQEVKVVDYYQGKHIPPGSKGVTISCVFRSPERTLTEAEVNPLYTLVCGLLTDQFKAQIR